MRAALLRTLTSPLSLEDAPCPTPKAGEILLRVRACGVCRTDLSHCRRRIARSQNTSNSRTSNRRRNRRRRHFGATNGHARGLSWVGGVDGNCPYCLRHLENLCDSPTFTGYTVDGGYAEYATARADFVFPLPPNLDDLHAAPLLCAGIIGFRSLRVAQVEPGDNVGLFGFGSSASLTIAVLLAWKCKVYVSTRGESHRRLAESLGPTGWEVRTKSLPWHSTARYVRSERRCGYLRFSESSPKVA